MFVPLSRTVVTAAWFVILGLVALLWSPPSLAMGVLVLFVGLACPAAMIALWKESAPVVAVQPARLERTAAARRASSPARDLTLANCPTSGV